MTSRQNCSILFELNADMAQLVEQLIRNQQVVGSSPTISSKKVSENRDLFYVLLSFCFYVRFPEPPFSFPIMLRHKSTERTASDKLAPTFS